MHQPIELLAPGGDIESIKAAIVSGADAIYCGLDRFNARNRATNISFDDLQGILQLAHSYDCQVFLTLNIVILQSEIPALFTLLNKLVNTSLDAVIVQDIGLLYILKNYFPSLPIHASTQMTTHNTGQIDFLHALGVRRVNLSRELNIHEITTLTKKAHKKSIETEVFVHGSNCLSFSGLCYMSSLHGGNSGNRGRCSQPCRDQYETTDAHKEYPLNLKDNSAFYDLPALTKAGVDSLKIEGRIKQSHYVATVVKAWRNHLDTYEQTNSNESSNSDLYKVFNRDFTNGLLLGKNSNDLFIDNPRDNSAQFRAHQNGDNDLNRAKRELYDEKTAIIQDTQRKIANLSTAKEPFSLSVEGEKNSTLKITLHLPTRSWTLNSKSTLLPTHQNNRALSKELLQKRFASLSETAYTLENIDITNLQKGLSLPFKELTQLKQQLLYHLLGDRHFISPVAVPPTQQNKSMHTPKTVRIISTKEQYLKENSEDLHYLKLPNILSEDIVTYHTLFTTTSIRPYFPAILIGESYTSAVELLIKSSPACIITDNTGIAYEAHKAKIPWIAGPSMNLTNSFALIALKETFGCIGAYVSSELKRSQIKAVQAPLHFDLYFSIVHPIAVMTTRQCLFHQVTGCRKSCVDKSCLTECEKEASITDLKGREFRVVKAKNRMHQIFTATHYENREIAEDLKGKFYALSIDMDAELTRNKGEATQYHKGL